MKFCRQVLVLAVLVFTFTSGCGIEGYIHHTLNPEHPYASDIDFSLTGDGVYQDKAAGPFVWKMNGLERFTTGNPDTNVVAREILRRAGERLQVRPPAVTDTQKRYDAQHPHDYASLAIYWWPDESSPDGKPYIRRDGQINPETEEWDYPALKKMAYTVSLFAQARQLSNDHRYAEAAELWLQTWFCDPETRMNPNLNFAQGIPGRTSGRNYGVIDTYHFTEMLDAIYLLDSHGVLSVELKKCMQSWFVDFSKWLLESPFGVREANTLNNHATWYDTQLTAYLTFTGMETEAIKIVDQIVPPRIERQISSDGSQPRELSRADGIHYSIYNLQAFTILSAYANRLGPDVRYFQNERTAGINGAMEYLNRWMMTSAEPDEQHQIEMYILRSRYYGEALCSDKLGKLLKNLNPKKLTDRQIVLLGSL